MFFHSKRSDNTKNSSSAMKYLTQSLKNKILHCFKRRHCEELCCEQTSQFYICVYIQCRHRRPTDQLHLKFPFPTETDVLVPVFSQSTDIIVVNFIVVLKFPNVAQWTLYQQNPCLPIAVENLSLVCRKGRSKEDLCYYTFDNHLCQYHHSWHESIFHRKGTVP